MTFSLDSDHCLRLSHVLHSFNAALNEEQCWAVAYQTLSVVQSSFVSSLSSNCCLFDPQYLFLKKDGTIHPKSLTEGLIHEIIVEKLFSHVISLSNRSGQSREGPKPKSG